MKELYTPMYGIQLVRLLKDNVNDLGMWSVYNKDLFNEEMGELEQIMKKLNKKIKALSK